MNDFKDFVPVITTLASVAVGAFLNFFVTRHNKSQDWKYALAKEKSAVRLQVYSEFLVESQTVVFRAVVPKPYDLTELNSMNNKFAELQMLATENVISCASKMADCALKHHAAKLSLDAPQFPTLREQFIVAVRAELKSIEVIS